MRKNFRSTPNLDELLSKNPDYKVNVFSKPLGRGSEGSVCLAELFRPNASPIYFGAKHRREHNYASGDTAAHERELHRLACMSNPHAHQSTGIIPYMGTFVAHLFAQQSTICHAMPLAEASLQDSWPKMVALKTTNTPLYCHVLFDFLRCMLNSMTQLSRAKIVHNDLNVKNILLYKGAWVVIDFGQAELYSEFHSRESRPRGSALNMPPELLVQDDHYKQYPMARDIWALGQIFKLLLGDNPMFHDTVPQGDIDAHLRAKKEAYLAICQVERVGGDHQTLLQQQIAKQSVFLEALGVFVHSMSHILPEQRPDLATFQMACQYLSRLLPDEAVKEGALTAFYVSIRNEKLAIIRTESTPDMDAIDGVIDCREIDLNQSSNNQSLCPSPVFFQQPLSGADGQCAASATDMVL